VERKNPEPKAILESEIEAVRCVYERIDLANPLEA
jgi:hypothetical protein